MALKQMESVEVKVGGMRFYITPFPALKAANLTGGLTSTLAPLVSVIVPIIATFLDEGVDMDVETVAQAVAQCQGIDGDKLESLVTKLLTSGNVVYVDDNGDATRLNMDGVNEIFCGNVVDMFILCVEVINVNYQGFFEKLGNQFGFLKKVTPEKEPTTMENLMPSNSGTLN